MNQSFPWISFIVISAIIFAFTAWFSLIKKRYHGIPRLISFECLAALVLLNLHPWFRNIFSWNQVISWVLLFGATFLAMPGFYQLEARGKPKGDFENTSLLVTTGIYRRIRHPLYASLLILGFGICFKQITWLNFLLAIISAVGMYFTAKIEEREMIGKFGESYIMYRNGSKMFIPFLI